MASSPDEILAAALELPDSDRLRIAVRLLDTVPADAELPEDDAEFLAELNRRANEAEHWVPRSELWNRD